MCIKTQGCNLYECLVWVHVCAHVCDRSEPWWCTNKNQAAMHPHTFLILHASSHPLPWWPDKTHTVLSSNWRRRWILTKWHIYTRRRSLFIHICQQSRLSQLPNWQTNANFLTDGNTSKPSIRGRDMVRQRHRRRYDKGVKPKIASVHSEPLVFDCVQSYTFQPHPTSLHQRASMQADLAVK